MQVEIKSVTQNDSEYQGKITKRLAIETSDGSYNVSEKNKSYSYIPVGYNGMAEVTFGNYKGKKYIERFKPLNTKPTQTTQKPHQQANKHINGAFKKDPAGILLEKKIQLYKNWTNVFNGCIELCKCGKIEVGDIITKSNEFFNASFETISNLNKPKESEPKADEHPEVLENENEGIDDVPF